MITQRLLAICLLLLGTVASADERILDYFSDIRVEADGSMTVEETIRVRAEGRQIKRGIYRDFPTDYQDRLGNDYRVGFELIDVLRDGVSEPHHTERIGNGIRIYAGSRDIFLQQGVYTYTFSYRTTRQLGFFDNHDELYWNVTGNGWAFPIDRATARVTLPTAIPTDQVSVEAYTGLQGTQGRSYTARVDYDGRALFETTRPLGRNEGLTIVAGWPKGHVHEPDARERLGWLLADNREGGIGLVGVIILLGYYLFAWQRVGRDPEAGVIIPIYTPPKGYSPASMRFIRNMGYDKKAFSAALVNMAVAGYITISEDSDGEFTISKTGNNATLAAGEGAIASSLFGDGSTSVVLKQKNHAKLGKAIKAHQRSLKRDYEKQYFLTNSGYMLPGYLVSVLLLVLCVLNLDSQDQMMVVGFMTLWLSIWSIAVFAMVKGIIIHWKSVISSGDGLGKAVFSSLFALPFIAGEFFGLGILLFEGSFILALVLGVVLVINILFYEWMKAPTLIGRQLLDRVDGFHLFLSVAEEDELKLKHPPEKTPELFERYLPYAIALDAEQPWGEKFTRILASASSGEETYHPRWYNGRSWHHGNFDSFANTMGGAMSSAIASSSTAPGSSSGSGGGGSSGGGGGGGGGGGW
ncbi:MAG: DUF2207 domain-containing protein [Sedimenticola sp.]